VAPRWWLPCSTLPLADSLLDFSRVASSHVTLNRWEWPEDKVCIIPRLLPRLNIDIQCTIATTHSTDGVASEVFIIIVFYCELYMYVGMRSSYLPWKKEEKVLAYIMSVHCLALSDYIV
jgi:hypothetical protein